MKSFKEFVHSQKHNGPNIGRAQMPQIKAKDMDGYITHLGKEGVKVEKDQIVDPRKLKPMQGEYIGKKIEGVQLTDKPENMHPIITTQDDYIIDGHHRWAAALSNGERKIKTHRVLANSLTAYNLSTSYVSPSHQSVYF